MLLEISQNSQEDTCTGVSFLHPFIKIESLTQVFFREFCEHLSKDTIFYRTPQVAASVKVCNFTKIRLCHGWFFCGLSKSFRNVFLMCCKNFLKTHKITGEKKICSKSLWRWLFRKKHNIINCDDNNHAICFLIKKSLFLLGSP